MKWNVCRQSCSPQSRRNFGERVLSNFITNIMAAIIDFDGSGRLGREINLYQGGGRRSKLRRGVGVEEWRLVMGCFAFQQLLRAGVFSPSPSPYLHRSLLLQSELITLACPNKTLALQATSPWLYAHLIALALPLNGKRSESTFETVKRENCWQERCVTWPFHQRRPVWWLGSVLEWTSCVR